MVAAQNLYDERTTYRIAWDTTQKSLQCCGINTAKDWHKIRNVIPTSCCHFNAYAQTQQCTNNSLFREGCLDAIAFDLSWQTSLLTGLGFIVIVMELATLIIASSIYIRRRMRYLHRGLHSVVYHHEPPQSQCWSYCTNMSSGHSMGDGNVCISNGQTQPPGYNPRQMLYPQTAPQQPIPVFSAMAQSKERNIINHTPSVPVAN